MKIDISKLEKFIITARGIVGRDEFSPYSLEDIYSLADKFEIDGIIYLEKFEDKRHVNLNTFENIPNITNKCQDREIGFVSRV